MYFFLLASRFDQLCNSVIKDTQPPTQYPASQLKRLEEGAIHQQQYYTTRICFNRLSVTCDVPSFLLYSRGTGKCIPEFRGFPQALHAIAARCSSLLEESYLQQAQAQCRLSHLSKIMLCIYSILLDTLPCAWMPQKCSAVFKCFCAQWNMTVSISPWLRMWMWSVTTSISRMDRDILISLHMSHWIL